MWLRLAGASKKTNGMWTFTVDEKSASNFFFFCVVMVVVSVEWLWDAYIDYDIMRSGLFSSLDQRACRHHAHSWRLANLASLVCSALLFTP